MRKTAQIFLNGVLAETKESQYLNRCVKDDINSAGRFESKLPCAIRNLKTFPAGHLSRLLLRSLGGTGEFLTQAQKTGDQAFIAGKGCRYILCVRLLADKRIPILSGLFTSK